ncbi:hypothetical protein ACRALDRAFT_2100623 [Sodiomyces alcalophilus JCM 7366]|uniref:uncharacterized protein n=1 Tax=Sodiomyces alcalophilus JCM 7366 TaxID=591952 RepID=UPI0039B4E585
MAIANRHTSSSAGINSLKKQKPLEISNLMSPPDPPPLENFNSITVRTDSPPSFKTPQAQADLPKGQDAKEPMSPPVSPDTGRDRSTLETTDNNAIKDPILYPPEDSVPSPPQQPLFPSSESVEHSRIVDHHIASRNTALFGGGSPPRREHYELTLQFKSQIMLLYTKNRRAWMEKERALLIKDREAFRNRWNNKRYPALAPAKSTKAPARVQPTKAVRTSGITKPDRVVKPHSVTRSPLPPHRQAKHAGSPPETSRRTVAPNREDRDFRALPDYCPPTSSLPNKANSLKVDWKGAPVDLSNDVNAHLLHPDELSLAANLRLDCATYLTSKRRIFIRRLECARIGKEFRKTDAQQACKIDVNKASKLWTAYEKVGWLDLKWMKSFA